MEREEHNITEVGLLDKLVADEIGILARGGMADIPDHFVYIGGGGRPYCGDQCAMLAEMREDQYGRLGRAIGAWGEHTLQFISVKNFRGRFAPRSLVITELVHQGQGWIGCCEDYWDSGWT